MIAFNLSGHGNFDLSACEAYLNGELKDFDYPEAEIEAAEEQLPSVPELA